MTFPRAFRSALALALAASTAGCLVGPNYSRPAVQTAPAYKEPGWSPAQPADLSPRGDWWTLFNDPTLDALEAKVAVNNQNVAAAEAAYRQAEALVREQRAALFPTVDLTGGPTRSGGGGGNTVITTPGAGGSTGGVTTTSRSGTSYRVSLGASWEPDIWGRIRRSIENARGAAQASQADLAAATLSAQGSLAADYFDLRETDLEIALLTELADGYQRTLTIASNRYKAGIAAHSDMLQAESTLASTQADLRDLASRRQTFEHAIAVLAGQAPESFDLPAVPGWTPTVPQVPLSMPSALLQRRPDIATAERRAAAASANIGVETAAYFPDITLSASYGFASTSLGRLFSSSASLWSLGAQVAETIFDAGARGARVAAARAAYDQAVAQYRQTTLAAFQDVEDQLSATGALADEYALRQTAAKDADLAATMVENQYREGQVAYTNVVTAQAQALSARRTLVQAAGQRQTAAVALIQALGGGWKAPF